MKSKLPILFYIVGAALVLIFAYKTIWAYTHQDLYITVDWLTEVKVAVLIYLLPGIIFFIAATVLRKKL